ncbi:stalk domain-containing protein [Paenibacillus sp. sgz500992]|uniref:stalk domain-containing protein n=1 Tax=Paenibacillus sp. sgz500992 TaxID=3242476 RepID=UPI0036D3B829
MMMKKIKIPAATLLLCSLIGVAPLTASAPVFVSAASVTTAKVENTVKVQTMDVKMIFDGVSLTTPSGQLVFIHNNSTYVPLRFVSYALQKNVVWDAKNLKVTVSEPTGSELVVIKEYLMNNTNNNISTVTGKSFVLNQVNAKYVFNGSSKALPSGQSSYMFNGTLYVPLRFLSESVGNEIKWDQKTKTITAVSDGYQGKSNSGSTDSSNGNSTNSTNNLPSGSSTGAGSAGSASSSKVSYESITSATESKLSALRSQSQSTLVSTAFEYLAATDEASKASIKAKGLSQLNNFTASFNSIVADAEKQLKDNGYNTDIIASYRSAFDAELEAGRRLAEGLGN